MRVHVALMVVAVAMGGCSVAFPMDEYDRGTTTTPSETGGIADGGNAAAVDAGARDAGPTLPACVSTRPLVGTGWTDEGIHFFAGAP